MAMNEGDIMTGVGWRQFCERMAGLGERILAEDFPSSERDRAEGFRHLANQLCCWLTYSIGHTDASYPQLFWHNNLVYRWGGPNVDQNARRAVIAGDGTYRISGNMHACNEFILQVKKGEMHTGGSVITGEARASDLGLGPGDDFEIFLELGTATRHLDSARSSVQPGSYPRLLLGLAASRISDVRH